MAISDPGEEAQVQVDICSESGSSSFLFQSNNKDIQVTCDSSTIATVFVQVNENTVLSVSQPEKDLEEFLNPPGLSSSVIDINLLSGKFPESVVICMKSTIQSDKDRCLGFLDK